MTSNEKTALTAAEVRKDLDRVFLRIWNDISPSLLDEHGGRVSSKMAVDAVIAHFTDYSTNWSTNVIDLFGLMTPSQRVLACKSVIW